MKIISKEEYISSIIDFESAYLIKIEDGKVFLRADIEYGGDIGLRIEMMDFEMNTELPLAYASSECCGHYAGGITFIEYESMEEAEQNVVKDFLTLGENAKFVSCDDGELKLLSEMFENQLLYVVSRD